MRTLRGILLTAAVTAVQVTGATSTAIADDAAVGFFTPTTPVYTSAPTPCVTAQSGGAAYDPSTGAIVVKPVTVQFGGLYNCI